MNRITRLLEKADWVQNRGSNWKDWQTTRFALTVIHPFRKKTWLHVVGDAILEFALIDILVEEGRLK